LLQDTALLANHIVRWKFVLAAKAKIPLLKKGVAFFSFLKD
jgi:hypothetical protein